MEHFPEIDVSDENFILFQSEIGGLNAFDDVESSWNLPVYSEANTATYTASQPVYESVYAYDLMNHTSQHPSYAIAEEVIDSSGNVITEDVTSKSHVNAPSTSNVEISMAHCMVCDELVNLLIESPHPRCQLKKPFKCEDCNEEFNVESNRLIHTLTTHTAENEMAPNFVCPICPNSKKKNYARFCGLKAHVKSHTKLDNFICKICQEEFQFQNLFNRHKRIFHANDGNLNSEDPQVAAEMAYCAACHCLIPIEEAKQHLKLHTVHRKIHRNEERKKTREMMKNKPPAVAHSTVILANDPIVPNVVVEKNKYACVQCTKSFKRPAELKRHMNTHSGEKYQCKKCGKRYTSESNLLRHMKSTHSSKKKTECSICGMHFTRESNLVRHVKKIHALNKDSKHLCKDCPSAFDSFTLRSSLKLHLDIHQRKEIDDPVLTHPRCPICMKHLSSENALRKHKKIHENKFECPQCFMKFPTIHKLDKHRCVPIANNDDQQIGGQMVELTGTSSQNRPSLENAQSDAISQLHQPLQKHFTCRICSMSFYTFRAYKEHNYQHQGLKPHLCWTCHKSFRTAELLSLHKEIHNREPIYCEYCPVVLHGRVEYLHHMRVAHQQYQSNTSNVQYVGQPMNEDRNLGSAQSFAEFTGRELTENSYNRLEERAHSAGGANDDNQHYFPAYDASNLSISHRCSVCLHLYDSASSLIEHWSGPVLDHSHSFTIVTCPLCPSSLRGVAEAVAHVHAAHPYFNSEASSNRMIRTSRPVKEKKRPFRCEMCRYSFGKRSDLKRHYLIHTGERPHKCHICGKAFRVKSALKDHLRIHENERDNNADQPTCTVCNKPFYSRSALILHMRQHSGNQPLECRFCPTSFRTSNLRQIHEEKVHNASKCHENDVAMSEASTSRGDRIQNTVNAVSSNTVLPQRKAILQGRLAAAKAQQMNSSQKQLFPVKMITQPRNPPSNFVPPDPALSTMSQISRLPSSTIQPSSSSAFQTIQHQSHSNQYSGNPIYILAKKISMNEYNIIVSQNPISPEAIRDGIDTLTFIDEQSLRTYSMEKYCIRLSLHDSQMLNIDAQQLSNALQLKNSAQVSFRALPFNPAFPTIASLLPPPHTEFVKRCEICDVEFSSREASEAHYASEDHETAQLMHPLTSNVEPIDSMSQFVTAASVPTRTDELSNFTCKLCGRKFLDMEPLVSHIRRDHERDNKFAPRPAARTAPIH
ncbi:hypothetical protein WR25_11294 [Diploscapter pachys]|uniref:C2H2-type domain-containing protein n=1 Tax=Diploscapter pachys TaxID=2018661 RepID=A0A2A2KAZ3_9BILA|nr:hypothetical protein WR25_11294 [Diploscapter pachys]